MTEAERFLLGLRPDIKKEFKKYVVQKMRFDEYSSKKIVADELVKNAKVAGLNPKQLKIDIHQINNNYAQAKHYVSKLGAQLNNIFDTFKRCNGSNELNLEDIIEILD